MKQEHLKNTITKGILENTGTATIWVLSFLVEAGALAIQSFLSPSLYADFPDATYLFSSKNNIKKKPKYKEITIRQSMRRLEKHGFVKKTNSKYTLTKKGAGFVKYLLKIKRNQNCSWDKRYRVVIFDIPEKKRKTRDWLRRELGLLKYKKLQNSVFVGKFPLPEELIEEIKKSGIDNCVNYLLVEKVYKNIL